MLIQETGPDWLLPVLTAATMGLAAGRVAWVRLFPTPYRVPLVHVWRTLYEASPRMTQIIQIRRRGYVERNRRGAPLYGEALDDGTGVVYLDAKPSTGTVIVTALHEWAHVIRENGRHDPRFTAELVALLIKAGIDPSVVLTGAKSLDGVEGRAVEHFDRFPIRSVRARWIRGARTAVAGTGLGFEDTRAQDGG